MVFSVSGEKEAFYCICKLIHSRLRLLDAISHCLIDEYIWVRGECVLFAYISIKSSCNAFIRDSACHYVSDLSRNCWSLVFFWLKGIQTCWFQYWTHFYSDWVITPLYFLIDSSFWRFKVVTKALVISITDGQWLSIKYEWVWTSYKKSFVDHMIITALIVKLNLIFPDGYKLI